MSSQPQESGDQTIPIQPQATTPSSSSTKKRRRITDKKHPSAAFPAQANTEDEDINAYIPDENLKGDDYDDDAAKDEENYIAQVLGVKYKPEQVSNAEKIKADETTKKDSTAFDEEDDKDPRVIYAKNIERAIKRYNVRDITNTKIISFVVWTVMVGMFYAFTYYNQNADDGFFMTNSFERKFRGHRFTFRYEDIACLEDVYTYLNVPFLNSFTEDEQGLKVSDHNIIVELLFHQNRVKLVDCDSVQAVEQFYDNNTGKVGCVPYYSPEVEETEPFGPNDTWTYKEFGKYLRVPMAYEYKPGGYVIKAPLTLKGLEETIAYLEETGFIDKQTAMFDIIMTAYNYNLDLYIEYVIVVEFPAGGEAFPVLYRCPFRDNIKRDIGLFVASVILFFLNIFAYFYIHRLQYYRIRMHVKFTTYKRVKVGAKNVKPEPHIVSFFKAFFVDFFNLVYFCDIIFYGVCFIWYLIIRNDKIEVEDGGYLFYNVHDMSNSQEYWIYASSYATFLGIITMFNHLTFISSVMILWSTLSNGVIRIIFFLAMFIVLVYGFVFLGHCLYGSYLFRLSSAPGDLLYMLTSAFNGLDYYTLEKFHPKVSIVFYLLFVLVIVTIFLNIFIAILNDAYEVSKYDEEADKDDEIDDTTGEGISEEDEKKKTLKDMIFDLFPVPHIVFTPFVINSSDMLFLLDYYTRCFMGPVRKKEFRECMNRYIYRKKRLFVSQNKVVDYMWTLINDGPLTSSERYWYRLFKIDEIIEDIKSLREENSRHIDLKHYLLPSPNALRFLKSEVEKDFENRGVANLIKLYLDDATACDYHQAEQEDNTTGGSNTITSEERDSYLGSAAFGCNCMAYCGRTIATVRGQTNGEVDCSLYEFNSNMYKDNAEWNRMYNEYEKYDRLIYQHMCGPYSGIPCEECYAKTRGLVNYITDQKIRCPRDSKHDMAVKSMLECAEIYRGDKMEFLTSGIKCNVCGAEVRSAYKLILYCRHCNFNAKDLNQLQVLCSMCAIMCGKAEAFTKFGIKVPKDFESTAARYLGHYEYLQKFCLNSEDGLEEHYQEPPTYEDEN